jgi:hypothetical protein
MHFDLGPLDHAQFFVRFRSKADVVGEVQVMLLEEESSSDDVASTLATSTYVVRSERAARPLHHVHLRPLRLKAWPRDRSIHRR